MRVSGGVGTVEYSKESLILCPENGEKAKKKKKDARFLQNKKGRNERKKDTREDTEIHF